MDPRDYYKILDIDTHADTDEIKRAYKKLAVKYHPDRNPDDKTASDRMALLNEAYAVLSNPEKRREYDQLRRRFGSDAAGRFRQNNTYEDILRHSDIEKIFQEIADGFGIRGLNELFKVRGGVHGRGFFFFGTFGSHGEAQKNGSLRGSHISHDLPDRNISFKKKILHGMGDRLMKAALNTLLKGSDMSGDINDTITISPSRARDGGPYAYYFKERDKKLIVKIPPGIKDGHKIRLRGAGIEDGVTGRKGDIFLTVNIRKNILSRIKSLISKDT
ncbi:MAG: J domain-containing protein [Desulfamplus sp.]|nr:J domain-containing protein [Desulfamplus sp.]